MAKNFKAWPENWPKTQYYPDIPVFAFLDQTASRVPNRIAMVFGGMELTYSEFKDLSDRFAAALLEQGVKKGDRVAIHLPNMPQFAIAYYGAIRIGAIYTPVSPLLSPQEARHQLEDAGAETPHWTSSIPEWRPSFRRPRCAGSSQRVSRIATMRS